ncbi:LysR substrate-binding domain-containing protein [Micromonospora sp. DT81.3]|uniref:LysR substrate-binding domain-containing protein n=1 Tax=Micromonospora sp. DT81.3 TaxID=3416523 RepID=UPI003CF99948
MSRPYRAHYAGGMAKGRPAKRGKRRADAAGRRPAAKPKSTPKSTSKSPPQPGPKRQSKPKPTAAPAPAAPPEEPRTFRLGAIPGATPGKWIDAWKERMPHVPLELVPLTVAEQRSALHDLDAALVRLPIERQGIDAIPLYDEVAVVIVSVDSALTVADELTFDDLAGEVVIVPEDDALGPLTIPGAAQPTFAAPAETADAVATVAAGVGVLLAPMSLARLHHRKDLTFRPLREGPVSTVALAWESERTTADVETFIGIVRGRTPHSSRD